MSEALKPYYRVEHGHLRKRNWRSPGHGWHPTPQSAIQQKMNELHDNIAWHKEEIGTLKLMLKAHGKTKG